MPIPVYISRIKAGFPSPAEDYKEKSLDLSEFLISNPDSTYFVWAEGDSMINAHIFSGDLLIVDRSHTAQSGDIVIASIDHDFTVKRLVINNGKIILKSENENFPIQAIELQGEVELIVWGVVTSVIHIFNRKN
jgi:DNA polymerase V